MSSVWVQLTQMNYLVGRLFKWVYKIPLSGAARNELSNEKNNLSKAQDDSFFNKIIPEYQFFYGAIRVNFMQHTAPSHEEIIDKYFSKAFEGCEQWPISKLENIVNLKRISTLWSEEKKIQSFLQQLHEVEFPSSSAHGDFHPGNIFFDKNKLFAIDWSYYSNKTSRYFDLLQYHVSLQQHTRWTESVTSILNKNSGGITLNDIPVSKEIILAYSIWRISNDIHVLKRYKRLTSKKIDKYKNFISFLAKKFPPNKNI